MENFQPLSRFLVLPVCGWLGFVACSPEEVAGSGAGGSAGTAAATAGTSSGAPAGGMVSGSGGTSGGQSSTSGATSGGAGSTSGGQSSGGTNAGGSAGAAAGAGAGGSSGSGGGSAMGCVGFTGKFCDDFEAQTDGQAPKGDFTVEGKVVVDSSKAYSGTKSMKVTQPDTSMLHFSKQFPVNDLHGRAMFYVTAIPGPNGGPHWDLVVAVSQEGINWEIGGMYGKFILIVDPPDTGVTSNTFPTGKWFCLQWQYKYAGAGQDNTFVAKMDGTALMKGEFTGNDPDGHHWNAGPWKNLSIGWTSYQSSDLTQDIWIDDLAFGEQPIACPPAK